MKLLGNLRIMADLIKVCIHCHDFLNCITLEHGSLDYKPAPEECIDGKDKGDDSKRKLECSRIQLQGVMQFAL